MTGWVDNFTRTDADIAAAATRALDWDAPVPVEKREVTVSRGWVTLRGEVAWGYQRREAERVLRRLSGVRGVTNLSNVRPRVQPSPSELKRRIENALVRGVETDAEPIEIDVEGSRVTLRGTVRSWLDCEEADRVAWSAPSVTSVDNRITVSL
jgi:osmotically-inducible protein OsmY